MAITLRTVQSRADLKKFIHLPAKIHRGHKNWIPPLYSDEWVFFSKGIKKSRGYLYPIGFIPVLLSGRRAPQLNLLLGAIRPDYQNRGLNTILGSAMLESARKAGKTHMDSHLEMETNTKVRAEMEYMGGEVYKRFRIFQRPLN